MIGNLFTESTHEGSSCSAICRSRKWFSLKHEVSLNLIRLSMSAILPNSSPSSFHPPLTLWKCEISWNSRAITRRPSRKLGDSTGKINWSQTSEPIWFTLQSLLWTPASVLPSYISSLSGIHVYTFRILGWSRGTTAVTPSLLQRAWLNITPLKKH